MRPALGWTIAVAALLLFWPLGHAVAQPLFSPGHDPLAGSRVFGTKGCVKCHAVNGLGGKIGPDLARIPQPRSWYDLAAAMWNHLPRMTERMRALGISNPSLRPEETADLIAFLFTLHYFDPPGDPRAGQRLFTQKRCILCHQVGGVGGVVGPNLDFLKQYGSPIFVATAMWNHAPGMTEAMRARGIERPSFKESELLDLIAYLKAASPAPVEGSLYVLPGRAALGRQLFAEKRCIDCHSVGGQGGRVGPDLGERGLYGSLTQFAAALWNKAPAMLEAMKRLRISLPLLRAEEMADLVAYLDSVQYFARPGDPRRGPQLVTAKGCLSCHALHGQGGTVASDLAQVKGLELPATIITLLWNHASARNLPRSGQESPWPEFSPEEMAGLVVFLQSLGERR